MQITGSFTPQQTSKRYPALLLVDEPNQSSDQLLLVIDGHDPALAPVTIAHVSAMMAGADWRITLAGKGVFTLSAPDLPESLTIGGSRLRERVFSPCQHQIYPKV